MSEEKLKKPTNISRRDFLKDAGVVIGGVALVGGALSGCTESQETTSPAGSTSATGPAGPAGESAFSMVESKGYLVFDSSLCIGCNTCELACSSFKSGKIQPSLSRIRIPRDPFSPETTNFFPMICYQCQDPKCASACIPGAITADPKTGARVVDESKCIGCGLCVTACAQYYGTPRINMDATTKKAFKCDLCGGDPQCIKWCPNGAIKYATLDSIHHQGFEQDFYEPYLKDFGPTYAPMQAYKITFAKAYPDIAGEE